MAELGALIKRIGHYSGAQILITASGFISFPILTRVLAPAEYGIMGMVLVVLNISIGVAKLGLGSSIVRLWPEWEARQGSGQVFVLTCLTLVLLLSVPAALLTDGITQLARPWIDGRLPRFILLASPLIAVRVLNQFALAVLQARQQSSARALFEIGIKYLAMVLAVAGAAAVIGGLRGYYAGLVLGEGVMMLALLGFLLRGVPLDPRRVSRALMWRVAAFGLPVAVYELSSVLLYTGDRFLIVSLLDEDALGYYTVAFNLAWYVNVAFTIPTVMAVGPAATTIYEREGAAAASAFLDRSLRFFLMLAIPTVAGVSLVRGDLVALMASERFVPGAAIVHVLVAGFLVAGSRDVVGMGLLLRKRPWLMAALNIAGTALNLGLNVALIPRLGTEGAAWATLAAQVALTVVFWALGSRLVRAPIHLPAVMRYGVCTAGMVGVILLVDPGAGATRLLLRVGTGMASYAALLLVLDGEARRLTAAAIARLRGRR